MDLAGSERLDRSQATGARKVETVAINKSLSALTDVFVTIGNKNAHIPFRNSKLTKLLADSLGGTASTALIATVGPAPPARYVTAPSPSFSSSTASSWRRIWVGELVR